MFPSRGQAAAQNSQPEAQNPFVWPPIAGSIFGVPGGRTMTGPHRMCPKCGADLDRIRRTSIDRLVSVFYEVHRYKCHSSRCDWSGLRHPLKGSRRGSTATATIWLTVGLLALVSAVTIFWCL